MENMEKESVRKRATWAAKKLQEAVDTKIGVLSVYIYIHDVWMHECKNTVFFFVVNNG